MPTAGCMCCLTHSPCHVLPQVEQSLLDIRKKLRHLPQPMTREKISDYVRDALHDMSESLKSIVYSTDIGGGGSNYISCYKNLIRQFGM